MSDHRDYSYPRTRCLPQESDTASDPDASVRKLIPRALRFIADVVLARVDDNGTYEWLRMAAGEIESLRDEVVRLKGVPIKPFCTERDRQERSRPCPTCGGMGEA